MRARSLPRLIAGAVLAGAFLIATATPAWAHAVLQASSPADGATLSRTPAQITLSYNENVEISKLGSIRLVTCSGERIDTGNAAHGASDREVVVGGIPQLQPGLYIVLWKVISADSHPVSGAISFQVGASSGQNLTACKVTTNAKSSPTVGISFGAARAALFAGLALLIGGAVFFVAVARGTTASRRALTVAWIGLGLAVAATIAGVLFQGPYAEGAGIGDSVKSTVVRDVLDTRYGHVAEWRLVLLFGAAVVLFFLGRASNRRPPIGLWIFGGVVGVALAATPGLAGHASAGDNTVFAVPLDTLHILAMSVWLGGLVALVVAALGGGFSGGLRRALIAFSRIAFWCVVVLVLTGIFASWRQVGFNVDGYLHTSYGNLLLAKLGVVVALVALAAISRSIVRQRRSAPLDAPDSVIAAVDERTVRGLRRSVGGEVLVAVAVLAITAVLVNAQPARSALAPKLFSKQQDAGTGADAMNVYVTVDPARTGPNQMHVYTLTPQGADLRVSSIDATLVKDGQQLPVHLFRADPHHYLNNSVVIPGTGRWLLVLHIRRGEFSDTPATFTIPVR